MTRHDPIDSERGMARAATPHELRMMARRMAVARRSLCAVLPVELVHDPALDILLALYQADDAIAANNLTFYTTVSAAAASRWLKVLESRDLILVVDGRVLLTANGIVHMEMMLKTVIEGQLAL